MKIEKNKKKRSEALCLDCIYKMAQYTSNEVDCSLYGRVNLKYLQTCKSFIEKKKAS